MRIENDMDLFKDRTVVVTGAGRGIGKKIAEDFVQLGAKVAIISRTKESSTKVEEQLNNFNKGIAKAYQVDISDYKEVSEIGKKIIEDLGPAEIIINNAGVTRDSLLLRMSEEDWDTVIDTNLKGAFNIIKAFQKSILKSKDARIINISSIIGLSGNLGQCNYSASKSGLIGFTKSLAKEFSSRRVCVNAIAPGFIKTEMTSELSEEIQDKIKTNIPLGIFGDVEDVSNCVLFLANPKSRYITGQVLTVDGGMHM